MTDLQTATNDELLKELATRFTACVFYGWGLADSSGGVACQFFKGEFPAVIGCAQLLLNDLMAPGEEPAKEGD